MEKSIIIQHLALPQYMLDYICSFLFYTEKDVIIRNVNHYNLVLNECKQVQKQQITSFRPTVVSFYYMLPRDQLMVVTICCSCGNYLNPIHHPNRILCHCY